MQQKTKQAISGLLTLKIKDPGGNIVRVIEQKNRIPTVGLTMLARYYADDGGFPVDPLSHLAVGTDATPAAPGDTALVAEVSRVAIVTQGSTGPVATMEATFTGGAVEGPTNLNEFGVFNDPADEMLARVVLASPITLPVGFSLQAIWDITFSYTQSDPKKVVTTVGLDLMADKLVGGAGVSPTHMEIGTGTTNPLPANTALETPVARVAFDSINVVGAIVSHVATFTGPLVLVTEQGVFNNAVGETMPSRVVFDGVLNLPVGNTLLSDVTEFVYGGV